MSIKFHTPGSAIAVAFFTVAITIFWVWVLGQMLRGEP